MKLRVRENRQLDPITKEAEVTLWLEVRGGDVTLCGQDQHGASKQIMQFNRSGRVYFIGGANLSGAFSFDDVGRLITHPGQPPATI
jgi:hypothetical protein